MESLPPVTTQFLLTCLPSLFFLGALCHILSVHKTNKALITELSEASRILEQKEGEMTSLKERYSTVLNFQESLKIAKLSTQLQKPRTSVQTTSKKNLVPEKYLYAQSLAEKGMSAEEIGSILTMSPHEADQLISLSRIAQAH